MHSDPTKRGRQVAERNSERRAGDLTRYLEARHGVVPADLHRAIREWMRAEFRYGMRYGRRLAKKEE
jgi:hypothetical protein